jgi:hypothetical protein
MNEDEYTVNDDPHAEDITFACVRLVLEDLWGNVPRGACLAD